MEKDEMLNEIILIIRKNLSSEFDIYLFGSWAKGNALPNSDLDIAILGPQAVDEALFRNIKTEAENIQSLRGADIIDLKKFDEDYKNNILKYAKKL